MLKIASILSHFGGKIAILVDKGAKKGEFRRSRLFLGLAASFDAPLGDCYTFIINLSGMATTFTNLTADG
jgi:hypothetical protein